MSGSGLRGRARSAFETALTGAGSALDRGAMRLIQRAMQSSRRPTTPRRMEDARARMLALAEHYTASAASFYPTPPAAEVTEREVAPRAGAARVMDLAWPSLYRPSWPGYADELAKYGANATARARLYRGEGSGRPVVICLHGWGAGQPWIDERAFVISYLLRIGLDAVLFQLPFHGERAPVQARRSGSLFLTSHLVRTNEAFGQAVFDLRQLAAWLAAGGAPAVGVLGMSLGSYVTALWAGLDRELAFAGALIPAVSMGSLWWSHGRGSDQQRAAQKAGVSAELLDEVFAVHAPLSRPPLLARERLFIAAALGDRITPPEQARQLWRHWGEPSAVWLKGGHLAQVDRGEAFRALRRWLHSLGLAR
jgi:pimeloyl-ACP methyl ester carboxylesterase